MKTVVHFPTRGRGKHTQEDKNHGNHNFFDTLQLYVNLREDTENTHFRIICDVDDSSMNNDESKSRLDSIENLSYFFDENTTKIEACNRRSGDGDYDIIMLASDDMIPQVKGYDTIIVNHMKQYFPDTDGALWYFDGFRRDLCTLSILGRAYYDRFGYIYHPAYKSFYCDDEHTRVGTQLGKLKFINKVLMRHDHPTFRDVKTIAVDETYKKAFSNVDHDKHIYNVRYSNNFK